MKRIIVVLALALVACGGKKDDKGSGTGSAPAPSGSGSAPAGSGSAPSGSGSSVAAGSGSSAAGSGSGSAGSGSAEATAQIDVPTEVDFEDEAQQKITEKNLEVELKAVETDLANN